MGLVCSSLPALAMEAWNNQQGGNKYQVIFDGKIYENAWWVSSTNCPGKAKANDATNPWRLKRTATAAEISQFWQYTFLRKERQLIFFKFKYACIQYAG